MLVIELLIFVTLPTTEAVESQVNDASLQVIKAASQTKPIFILVWFVTDDEILDRFVIAILSWCPISCC